MQDPIAYDIKPTKLLPNSHKPLLHYKKAFVKDGKADTLRAYETFVMNGWDVQWVTRYGRFQRSHYHPETPEAMVVISGPGTIRWGVADLDDDPERHTYGDAREEGGLLTEVEVGDVFVIPAGVAHKSYDPSTSKSRFGSLINNEALSEMEEPEARMRSLEPEGFAMMGAYPRGLNWSWAEGGDSIDFQAVWDVGNPELDPVVGSDGGTGKYWG